MKYIKFTDGTKIAAFEDVAVPAETGVTYTVEQSYVIFVMRDNNVIQNPGIVGKVLTDLDGNTWSFQTENNTLVLRVTNSENVQIFYFSFSSRDMYTLFLDYQNRVYVRGSSPILINDEGGGSSGWMYRTYLNGYNSQYNVYYENDKNNSTKNRLWVTNRFLSGFLYDTECVHRNSPPSGVYTDFSTSVGYVTSTQTSSTYFTLNNSIVDPSEESITYNLTNCTGSSANPTTFEPGEDFEVIFTADEGYSFVDESGEISISGGSMAPTPTPTLVGTTISFWVRPAEDTTITISVNPTQDPNVEYRLVNCVKTAGPAIVEADEYFDILLTAATGYQFNSLADVVATSASLYEYRGSTFPSSTFYARYKANASFTKIIIASNLGGDPYSLFGEGELGGDSISPTTTPTTTAVTSGIIALFKPTIQEMQNLADFMWTDFGGTAITTDDILKEIFQAIKRSISNPLDYIFGLNIIPSQGLSTGGYKTIRFGYVSSGVSMLMLSSQFFDVDCGSLSFDTVCGNTFLDYAPYAKFSIYLPYVGFREVDANDFVGHTIGVKYKCDAVSGACVAYVTKDGSVMYQYAGNVACTIPLSADSWASTLSGVVNSASNLIGKVAMGAAVGGPNGAMLGGMIASVQNASNVASNPSQLAPQVSRSGAVSGAAGLLGVQYPFVIREAVRFHSTEGFNTISGYPSWYFRRLGDLVGFTKVVDVHLHYINALRDEIDEIELLLKGGVIL